MERVFFYPPILDRAPGPVFFFLLLLLPLPAALAPRLSANVAVLEFLSLTATTAATIATVSVRWPTG